MAVWTQPVWAEVVILDRWTVACLFASSERKALLSQRPRSPQGRPSGAGTHADAKDGQRWRLLTYARDCRYQIAPFARAAGAWGCDRACMDERVQHEANGCVSLKPFPHYDQTLTQRRPDCQLALSQSAKPCRGCRSLHEPVNRKRHKCTLRCVGGMHYSLSK